MIVACYNIIIQNKIIFTMTSTVLVGHVTGGKAIFGDVCEFWSVCVVNVCLCPKFGRPRPVLTF